MSAGAVVFGLPKAGGSLSTSSCLPLFSGKVHSTRTGSRGLRSRAEQGPLMTRALL